MWIRIPVLASLSLALLWALSTPALGTTLEGRVVGVADGDTVTVLSSGNIQTRIRLFQIDAPEKAQSMGQKSKASLSELVYGKTVTVNVETLDRYGRTVGTLIQNGVDINLEQIRRGMAWVYRQYARDPHYFEAEETARAQHAGLWAESNPTPPWVFRHGEKAVKNLPTPTHSEPYATCNPDLRCREISTCEEAMEILSRCGPGKIDGDHDGIPCESLCKHSSN